ncbi:solute carrier family 49 member 4-like isoform X2 [Haliotis rufescens]|uniref:solute carrier family 49 member 4-like isoform X2 n=1 Tax=Haliotis rufescens TaxID=6454 RepID=UPI001EAFCB96|nr:solute carrier family 49 member 4-like isoform X2 [Haliotis rufescens]
MTESVVTDTNELPRSTDDNVTSDPNEQKVKEIIQLEKGDKESVWPQSGRRRSSVTFDENVTQIRFERVEQLDLHVYRRRWVVLALFSLFSCLQAAVWNQWGPIAAVSERVFGWTDGTIALFVNWGPIAYILTAPLWSWILDTKGPQVVQEDTHVYNFTLGNRSSLSASDNVMEADVISQQRHQIMNYQYATFGVCAVVLLTMLMYFPSRPPKPPSPSAATTRLDYLAGLKQLFRKGRFWQIGLAYGVSTGTRDAWSSMLDVNLKAHEISQKQAGWLGFYGTIAGSIAVIVTARFADHFQKRLKLFILLLTIITTAAYLWLILLILGILPESKGSTYASYILTSISSGSLSPLFYELVCETSYPVAEGVTNVSLTSMNNLAGLVFLGVMSVPGIGTVWMNWLLVSTFCLAIFLLILLPEGHNRLDVDQQQGDPAQGTC